MTQVQAVNLDQLFRQYLIRRGFVKTLTNFEAELKADLRVKKLQTKSKATKEFNRKKISSSITSKDNKDLLAQTSVTVKKITFMARKKKRLANSLKLKTSPPPKTILKCQIGEQNLHIKSTNNKKLKSSVSSVTYIQIKNSEENRTNHVNSDISEETDPEKTEKGSTSLEGGVTEVPPGAGENSVKGVIETVVLDTRACSDDDLFDPFAGCSADVFCECIHCRLKFQEVPVQHIPEGKQVYFCNLCNTEVKTALTLKHHRDTNCSQLKLFICEACGKSFSYQRSLKNHFNSVHLGLKPESKLSYKCRLCSAVFRKGNVLRRHIRNIHASVGVSHVCKLCDKVYACESYLQEHVRRQHESEQVLCDHCSKLFPNKIQFKKHMQRVNEKGIRPRKVHPCLMRQICEICGKSIKGRKNLSLHILNKHTEKGEPDLFICEVCGKGCKTKRGLRVHSLTHTLSLKMSIPSST